MSVLTYKDYYGDNQRITWKEPTYNEMVEMVKPLLSHRTFLGKDFDLTTLVDVGYHEFIESWKAKNDLLLANFR